AWALETGGASQQDRDDQLDPDEEAGKRGTVDQPGDRAAGGGAAEQGGGDEQQAFVAPAAPGEHRGAGDQEERGEVADLGAAPEAVEERHPEVRRRHARGRDPDEPLQQESDAEDGNEDPHAKSVSQPVPARADATARRSASPSPA